MPGTSNFPTSLDTFPDITPTTHEDAEGFEHDVVHNNEAAAISALQAKVGIDDSDDPDSLDYLVSEKADRDADQTFRTRTGNTGGGDIYTRNVWHGPVAYTYFTDVDGNRLGGIGMGDSGPEFLVLFRGSSPAGGGDDPLNVAEDGAVNIPVLTSTTQSPADNSTKVATTAYADAAAESALDDANDYTDAAIAGLGAIHYRRDDFTATGYENQFTFDKTPYESAIEIFKNGALVASSAYTVGTSGGHTTVLLTASAAGGESYSAKYWTGTASPGATTFVQASDPSFAFVVSGLHFDGTNGSTTFTDIKGKTWTASGSPQLETATKKFGTASLKLDGSSSISCSSSDFTFGTGDFTIRCWVNGNTNSNKGIFANQLATSHIGAIGIAIASSSQIFVQNNDTSTLVSATLPSGFFHVEMTRASGSLRTFINGTLVHTVTDTRNISTTGMYIGGYYSTSFRMAGNIDDFEVYKGVALHTASFTPGTGPFPDS